VRTLRGRAEDLHARHGGGFDVVTARAVASLEQLIPWALPFLRPGGQLRAIKGQRWPEELQAALPAIARFGAHVIGVPGKASHAATPAAGVREDSEASAMPRVVTIQAAG
jgi:16S rRNA (guanine527-N7)-methyltransferase